MSGSKDVGHKDDQTAAIGGGARFTPGPWFVEHTAVAGMRIVHGEPDEYGFRDDVPLGRKHDALTDEVRANLALTAAAPELLAALEVLTDTASGSVELSVWPELIEAIDLAHAAIERARATPTPSVVTTSNPSDLSRGDKA